VATSVATPGSLPVGEFSKVYNGFSAEVVRQVNKAVGDNNPDGAEYDLRMETFTMITPRGDVTTGKLVDPMPEGVWQASMGIVDFNSYFKVDFPCPYSPRLGFPCRSLPVPPHVHKCLCHNS
jgi:hypothetical protein